MQYLESAKSNLRKLILIGWAFAVVWIYLGNLVNFHQHRIWGKQLIPVACYSTRAKEKDGIFITNDGFDSRIMLPGTNFDFTTPDQYHVPLVYSSYILLTVEPANRSILKQDFTAFSLRGPPSL
jgi:hypothetical protein